MRTPKNIRYKLLAVFCILAANVFAQEQKPAVDYTRIGSAMPPFKGVVYHYKNKDTSSTQRPDSKPLSKKELKKLDKELRENEQLHYITSDDLTAKGNIFIMMFNPNCSHCQEEAIKINDNIDLFKNSKIVLLANPAMKDYIPDFIVFSRIAKQPKLPIVIDSSGFVDNTFLYQALPQINIYNKAHKLIKTYTGDVPIDSLSQYAR